MTANYIIDAARITRLRELNSELARVKARLNAIEQEHNALTSHFDIALSALHDLRQLNDDEVFRIIDGWNVILRNRNVERLDASTVSRFKSEFLKRMGAERRRTGDEAKACVPLPIRTWIIFDGSDEGSYVTGECRVSYTGGVGLHRADRLIADYVHAAKLLGLNPSRICVETADKELVKKIKSFGATVRAS